MADELVSLNANCLEQMQTQLKNNQIFMNMVVHDMRSPTVSIKLGLEYLLANLKHHAIKT